MKMLIVCQNLKSGGAERVICNLSNYFSRLKNEITILMISPDADVPFYSIDNSINLINLASLYNLNQITKFQKLKIIQSFIKNIMPDVVIPFLDFVTVYTFFAVRRLKNIKLIVSERCDPTKSNFLMKLLKKYIYLKADGCVFQTEQARKFYSSKIKKSIIIPNPVSLNFENNFDYHNKKRLEEIILVGSKKKEKNRKMAYKSFSILLNDLNFKNWKLKIYGESTLNSDTKIIRKLNIDKNVEFMGVDKDWQKKSMSSSVFILTSNYEGMPNALLEAACLQIPCISTDCPVGGPSKILREGFGGILIPVNDYREMAKQLKLLCLNRSLQNIFSDRNAELRYLYDVKIICKTWLNFIEEIICD